MRSGRVCGDEGFSLLELMAVVLILGILVGIAVASYNVSMERSRRVTCQMNQRTLNNAVLAYAEQHSAMPGSLEDVRGLVKGQTGTFAQCPSDTSVSYQYDPLNGRVTCPNHPAQ